MELEVMSAESEVGVRGSADAASGADTIFIPTPQLRLMAADSQLDANSRASGNGSRGFLATRRGGLHHAVLQSATAAGRTEAASGGMTQVTLAGGSSGRMEQRRL